MLTWLPKRKGGAASLPSLLSSSTTVRRLPLYAAIELECTRETNNRPCRVEGRGRSLVPVVRRWIEVVVIKHVKDIGADISRNVVGYFKVLRNLDVQVPIPEGFIGLPRGFVHLTAVFIGLTAVGAVNRYRRCKRQLAGDDEIPRQVMTVGHDHPVLRYG